MANKRKGKLELDWVDKGDIILTKFHSNGKTYPASYFQGQVSDEELMPRELELIETVGDPDSENMLIWGENLVALRSLEREFAGKIKLIYIDPPFNTGQDFEDYEDGLEHSIWLSMMENRLRVARKFLRKDGGIFVHIDIREMPYLKPLMDEIFNRRNVVALITLKVKDPAGVGQESIIFDICEYLVAYAFDYAVLKNDLQNRTFSYEETEGFVKGYNKAIIDYGRGELVKTIQRSQVGEIRIYEYKGYEIKRFKRSSSYQEYADCFETIFADYNPSGGMILAIRDELPPEGLSCIEYVPIKGKDAGKLSRVFFLNRRILAWLKDVVELRHDNTMIRRQKLSNLWEVVTASLPAEGDVYLPQGKKPEALLRKIIGLMTTENDYVLDLFAGTGTTGAVAHKMRRKWIMAEIRKDMVFDKALKRMKNVVAGDQTGVSKEVGWKGGGGFKFYKLGEPLIVKHKDYPSIRIINPKYYNTALIKVICDLEGFKFRKDDKVLHGVNRLGNKYAHITEQYVSQGYIDFLKGKLADNEEIIVYCFSYDDRIILPFNMIIKKLPADIGKSYQMRLRI